MKNLKQFVLGEDISRDTVYSDFATTVFYFDNKVNFNKDSQPLIGSITGELEYFFSKKHKKVIVTIKDHGKNSNFFTAFVYKNKEKYENILFTVNISDGNELESKTKQELNNHLVYISCNSKKMTREMFSSPEETPEQDFYRNKRNFTTGAQEELMVIYLKKRIGGLVFNHYREFL